MNKIIALYFILFTNIAFSQQRTFELKKCKIELSLKLDGTKRKSLKYFDNDTTDYSNYYIDPAFDLKNNFLAGNIELKKYIKYGLIISSVFRYKLWGFKERFITPNRFGNGKHDDISFSVTMINIDFSINVMKRIKLYKNFELRPRVGVTLFHPFTRGFDSTVYIEFDKIGFNNYYKGKPLKMGGNLGAELNYKVSNRFAITYSAIYYSPFNNTYNWIHGERVSGTHYPWRKWAKKNDGLYFGLGLDFALRKRYKD